MLLAHIMYYVLHLLTAPLKDGFFNSVQFSLFQFSLVQLRSLFFNSVQFVSIHFSLVQFSSV